MSTHARAHVLDDKRFDHKLSVLFVEKNPTGRDLADVRFRATNSVEIAVDCEGRAAALGLQLRPLRFSLTRRFNST